MCLAAAGTAADTKSLADVPSAAKQGGWQPIVLDNDRLDLAVARGAAYYGMVRRGQGVRIAAGLARTYYIGVEATAGLPSPQSSPKGRGDEQEASPKGRGDEQEASPKGRTDEQEPPSPAPLPPSPAPLPPSPAPVPLAVCLLPTGIEPGHDITLSQRRFDLLVSEPAEFPLFVSSTRLTDKPGELVPIDRERMTPLPPLRTVLRTRKKEKKGTGPICRDQPSVGARFPGASQIGPVPFFSRNGLGQPARAADGNRHARSVVQRDWWPAELAASVRRAFDHADRHRRPPIGGRKRGRRRGDLARVSDVDREHVRCRRRR